MTEDIIEFLMSGDKGRDDFWLSPDFYQAELGRGIYPRKSLHMLLEEGFVEKFIVDRRIRWRLVKDITVNEKIETPVAELEKPVIPPIPEPIPVIEIGEVERDVFKNFMDALDEAIIVEEEDEEEESKEETQLQMPEGLSFMERRRWKKENA